MNRLSLDTRSSILGCLTEGMSLRAASRLADVSINTVTKLLVEGGYGLRDVPARSPEKPPLQADSSSDEIWCFVGSKKKQCRTNAPGDFGRGDVYTWVAIDAETKLVASWLAGRRNVEFAKIDAAPGT